MCGSDVKGPSKSCSLIDANGAVIVSTFGACSNCNDACTTTVPGCQAMQWGDQPNCQPSSSGVRPTASLAALPDCSPARSESACTPS